MNKYCAVLTLSVLITATTSYASEKDRDWGGSGKKDTFLTQKGSGKSRWRSTSDSSDSDDDSGWTGSSIITGGGGSVIIGGGGSSSYTSGISLSGGSLVIVNGRVISSGGSTPFVVGSGTRASKTWTIGTDQHFSGIRANGVGSLEIISGDTDQVTASADDNIIGKLSVSLKGDDLAIELEAKSNIQPRVPISYIAQFRPATLALLTSIITGMNTRIKAPLTTKKFLISTTGTNTFTAESDLKIENELSLQKSGTGTMSLARIAAQQVMLNHSGTGRLAITGGRVPFGMFNISGTGSVAAERLILDTLMLSMSGTGSLDCTVQSAVNGSLSGTGCFSNHGQGSASGLRVSRPARYRQLTTE